MYMHRIAFLLCCGLLAACGADKTDTSGAGGDDGLPKPAATTGSVTGMPNPGVPEERAAPRGAQQPELVELPEPVDAGESASPEPDTPSQPILGAPVILPDSTMSEDPDAPSPPPPEQSESRALEDAQR